MTTSIPYVEFMRQALAAYYGQLRSFADFTTAPELSPLFGQTLASACAPTLRLWAPAADLLEFGPGSGKLAASVLQELAHLDALPRYYYLLEPSPSLRALQAQTLSQLPPALARRLVWLERLPTQLRGVILANEVLDALPVELFEVAKDGWRRGYVVTQHDRLHLAYQPDPDPAFQAYCTQLAALQTWPTGYRSEFAPQLPAWMATVAELLEAGMLVISDYGDTGPERYHPSRSQGTLRAYTRQQLSTDVLAQPGAQDLTADVDFSAVLHAAQTAGLSIAYYGTQARFLLQHGLLERLQRHDPQDTVRYLQLAQQVKTLLLPDEMGERFKIACLSRD